MEISEPIYGGRHLMDAVTRATSDRLPVVPRLDWILKP
jgi:hypothetical protein